MLWPGELLLDAHLVTFISSGNKQGETNVSEEEKNGPVKEEGNENGADGEAAKPRNRVTKFLYICDCFYFSTHNAPIAERIEITNPLWSS